MIPAQYATPAAVVISAGGFLACFAGYRLFRLVLGIYGFMLGVAVSTLMFGTAGLWTQIVAALAGGVVGALLMIFAYFTGVGLVGAGLAALALNVVWRVVGGEPPTIVLVIVCVLGALGALSVSRLVVIFGTALGGAWTLVLGVMALLGSTQALDAAFDGEFWMVYPLEPLQRGWWPMLAWVALAIGGVVVQMSTSSKTGRRKLGSRKKAA